MTVLRGGGGAALRHEGDALTLRRGDEELRIPLRAVQRVSPGGEAVVVALRVPEGAEPVVHVVRGVNDMHGYAFASAMGAVLGRLPEPGPSFDGTALVTTRSLGTRGGWGLPPAGVLAVLAPGVGAFLAMSVLVVLRGEPAALVLAFLLGIAVVVLNLSSVAAADRAIQMWRLPRRGVTVTAVRTGPYGRSGTYAYTDGCGTVHGYRRNSYADEVRISFHPKAPGRAVGVYPGPVRVLVALGALVLWAATGGLGCAMVFLGLSVGA
ncbi:hypothetical protein ACH414_05190 [Streptomyces sp. NPDC020422]|uniref:hypothetical protein n=1 Tax=Streptomyces sp. NPDC020422 TaxID=3365074 RepID=UPI0037A37B19